MTRRAPVGCEKGGEAGPFEDSRAVLGELDGVSVNEFHREL